MIVTSWNIRGLNSKGKQRYLKERVKKDQPSIMIIQETKINSQKLEEIARKYKIQYEVIAQDVTGTAGGLAILWNPEEVQVKDWVSLPRILSGSFRMIGSSEWVLITGVYSPHIPRERKNFLKDMQTIRRIFPGIPWIVGGDFNMIKSIGEKKGGKSRPDQDMEAFSEIITEQRLVDIPRINGVYTWNNRRGGRNQIACRLDQFLVSEQILNRDVFVEAKILPALGSDHWPIRLEIDIRKNPHKFPFRFEAFWLRNNQFILKVEEW